MDMEAEDFSIAVNAMKQIEAQESLLNIQLISFPHNNSKNQREKLHKQLHKIAYPNEKRGLTLQDLDKLMETGLIDG